MSFNSLELDSRLKENLESMNFTQMTPVQEDSLPSILKGDDLIVQAKTGSGKTVAFGLGVINALDVKNTRVQTLILCPTRELTEQVATELRTLCRSIAHIKILTITGGRSEYHQERSLAHGAHIVVGTPGRVRKLLRRRILELQHVKSFVLDEADRMLEMGFLEDLETIANFVPTERQTLLFSATFPENIRDLSQKLLYPEAGHIKVAGHDKSDHISETFYSLGSHREKTKSLIQILGKYTPERFIVFCKTKRITDDVANALEEQGLEVESIHGDLEQRDRDLALVMFSNRSLSGLIATDVASRGIDIKNLDMVINYDLPTDPEVYVHRIGRTGRAGEHGVSVSFMVPQELELVERIGEYKNIVYPFCQLAEDVAQYSPKYELLPSMATLYVSGGKRDKLRPGDLVGAIVGESGIDSGDIGDIQVGAITTYVAIKRELAKHVVESLRRGKIKNRNFKVGLV